MNIVFFTRRFYPDIGGVEKHVFEIGKMLVKNGHKIIVITESTKKTSQKKAVAGMDVYRFYVGKDDWFKKFRIWKSLWSFKELIQNADVIHCHDVFFWYLPFRFLYPEKPVFTTFHGYESYPISKKAIIIRKISEKLSWGNICIGDFIGKWYGTSATFVSYGAVDVSKIKDLRFKIKDQSAVFIGRLDEQTGILTYIKAVEILRKKYPEFQFVVIGDGKYKSLIEKKIKVLGFKKNPERYLQKYHFVFVSRYLSILEAFAAKKLVFAVYDNPVKEDYLKMAPFAKWIITVKDEDLLAQKVEYYLRHPEEEKVLISKAYNWVMKQTWEQMVNVYMTLWKNNTIIRAHE